MSAGPTTPVHSGRRGVLTAYMVPRGRRYRFGVSAVPVSDRVVLLHGQPGVGAEWQRVVEDLGGLDVVAPDRPGYGFNPRDAAGIAANADWLTGEVVEGSPAPSVVVGHSWAGSVALALGLHNARRVRGLVLVASVGPGAITRMDRVLAHSQLGPALMRPALAAAHMALPRVLRRTEPNADARRALRRAFDANYRRGVWRSFLVEQDALLRELPTLLDGLEQIALPTVIVAGTRDRVVPFATARALADRIPNAELVTVQGGGHLLHRTHPEVIADAVRALMHDSAAP